MKPASFIAITSEGGLLPADFLTELLAPKTSIAGLEPKDYSLAEGERVSEQVNRSWQRLKGRWADFKKVLATKQPDDPTTTETRDRWLHPIFQELGFGQRLPVAQAIVVDGHSYPVSHGWSHVPIHLVGAHADLDRRTPGAIGAAKASPYSLVQQALNASDKHLWGVVSNGLVFRLLRDNIALTRLSYVEWDLAAIFDGDLYSEFFVFWLVCHQSRFEGERPEQCLLEQWKKSAGDRGLRALDELRPGVASAIEALGAGLVSNSANHVLLARLRSGDLTTQEFYRQVLRVIYRMLFLFVAEDRDLLHPPLPEANASKVEVETTLLARQRYRDFYAITRLRGLTLHRTGTPHPDLWHIFQLLTQKLGSIAGCPELALPALGSFLWEAPRSTPDLIGTVVSNRHLLTAVHALAFVQDGSVRRPIDYKNLGSEELGSVYEGLLELHPRINAETGVFTLNTAAGNERKTSGSYYTPDSLVQCLLDSALEPVMAEAMRGKSGQAATDALLRLKICDPAVGSGHFLIAAAHRMARRVAAARSGEDEPSPAIYRKSLRDVIGHCLYGVDINPMSAELCRVSLWLEALEPGKPLSFLDHHIRVGNSLLGAKPELIKGGIPDEAFDPIEGDDKEACAALKKRNKRENPKLGEWFIADEADIRDKLFQAAVAIDEIGDSRIEEVRRKETAFHDAQTNYDFQKACELANLWCAAFVIKKRFPTSASEIPNLKHEIVELLDAQPIATQGGLFGGAEELPKSKCKKDKAPSRVDSETTIGITTQHLRDFVQGGALPNGLLAEANGIAEHYNFFHWHLAFPEVFTQGGFDVNLGNPPWETLSPDAKEFFSTYDPEVRNQDKNGQAAIIERLLLSPGISSTWKKYRRDIFAVVHFIKDSGRYQLFAEGNLGKGDFNIYRMFVETALQITRKGGFATQFVPEGFYNGANCAAIRDELFTKWRLELVLGFENTREVWFKDVHTALKFTLYAARLSGTTDRFLARFNIRSHEALSEVQRGIGLQVPVSMVREFSPDALAIMEFGDQRDIDIATKMYARWPKFGDESAGPPMRTYMREFDMGGDREVFGNDPDGLPLYEGRMVDLFDYRAKGYRSGRGRSAVWEELPFGKPGKSIQPQWRVPLADIPEKVRGRMNRYRIGFCDVASSTNERSLYAALLPPGAVSGHKVPTILFTDGWDWAFMLWIAVANSFAMDFISRKKVSLSMSYTVLDSLPFPRMGKDNPLVSKLVPMALRLTCCGPEMTNYWNSMAAEGWVAPCTPGEPSPGAESEDKRLKLRADLDALVARDIFGLTAVEMEYILATFPTWREREEKQYGEFRTKRLILEAFESLPRIVESIAAPVPQIAIPAPKWMDRPLVVPTSRRVALVPDRYRAALVPHLLYQAGGSIPFERFRKAYWLLTEPKMLEHYGSTTVGDIARKWSRTFGDTLQKDMFIEHLKGAVGRQLHFIIKDGERWLELRDPKVADDEHIVFDARLALLVADIWPVAEPIAPLAPAEEIVIQELEAAL